MPPDRRPPPPPRSPPAPAPQILRRHPHLTSSAPQNHKPAAAVSQSSWERFFLDSPPPPPRHGHPLIDEVEWVPSMPDPSSTSPDPAPATSPPAISYADAVRFGRPAPRQRPANPAFTPLCHSRQRSSRPGRYPYGSARQKPASGRSARHRPAPVFTPREERRRLATPAMSWSAAGQR